MFDKIKNVFILLLSLFFLVFGIDILWNAFALKNPLEFVMTLFAASFIILFCLVCLIYVFFRLYPTRKSVDEIDHADTE